MIGQFNAQNLNISVSQKSLSAPGCACISDQETVTVVEGLIWPKPKTVSSDQRRECRLFCLFFLTEVRRGNMSWLKKVMKGSAGWRRGGRGWLFAFVREGGETAR